MNEHAPLPFVVFVTAHHRYALKAFDVDAVVPPEAIRR